MKNNPYTISFGKKPSQYITRPTQTQMVIDDFQEDNPSNQIYMITGVRGSGKTVLMTSIARELCESKEWVSIELNPEKDLMHSLAAKLYAKKELQKHFAEFKMDFSALGLGVAIENGTKICDDESAVSTMLEYLKGKQKRS